MGSVLFNAARFFAQNIPSCSKCYLIEYTLYIDTVSCIGNKLILIACRENWRTDTRNNVTVQSVGHNIYGHGK